MKDNKPIETSGTPFSFLELIDYVPEIKVISNEECYSYKYPQDATNEEKRKIDMGDTYQGGR